VKQKRFPVLGFRVIGPPSEDNACAAISMMCFILKTSLAFAAIGYLVALGLYFAPLGWHIPSAVAYAICPAAYLTITVDPSFAGVALALGPVNASVYGVIGLAVGLVLWFLAKLLKRERR